MIINSWNDFEKKINEAGISGAIVVCGHERQLMERTIGAIYNKINVLPEMNTCVLSGDDIIPEEIENACETIPIMGDKRLVHIKNPDFLVKEDKRHDDEDSVFGFIARYIPRVPEYTILLMTVWGDINEKGKTAAAVKSAGTYIKYSSIKKDELYKWIEGEFASQGKTITKSDIHYLTSLAGNSTERLENEIEKLICCCRDERTITRSHIDLIVHRSLEDNIFKMTDAITRRDADTALSILNVLLTEKEKPLAILAMISRQYRLVLMSKGCMQLNMAPEDIGKKLRLSGYPLQNMLKQARICQEGVLKSCLKKCLETDYSLKNGRFLSDEADLALEMLITELCR